MSYWSAIAMGASQILSSDMAASSAAGANKMNYKIWQEQKGWNEMMSNTAIQRRKADLIAAGGNPALAFTNGDGASAPTTNAPVMNPEKPIYDFTAAALAAAQLKNVNAQTRNTNAEAKMKEVEANINESLIEQKRNWQSNKFTEEFEQQDIKTRIMRSIEAQTGAQSKVAEETADALIATARQQARAGKIDLDALENVARMHGVEGSKMAPVLKNAIDLIRVLRGK